MEHISKIFRRNMIMLGVLGILGLIATNAYSDISEVIFSKDESFYSGIKTNGETNLTSGNIFGDDRDYTIVNSLVENLKIYQRDKTTGAFSDLGNAKDIAGNVIEFSSYDTTRLIDLNKDGVQELVVSKSIGGTTEVYGINNSASGPILKYKGTMVEEDLNDINLDFLASSSFIDFNGNGSLNGVFGGFETSMSVYEMLDTDGLQWRFKGTMKDENGEDIIRDFNGNFDFVIKNNKTYAFEGREDGNVGIYEMLDNDGLQWKFLCLMKDKVGNTVNVGYNSKVSLSKDQTGEIVGVGIGSMDQGISHYRVLPKDPVGVEDSNPMAISLFPNYPNPFNPTTTIDYRIPRAGNVRVEVYNSNGQLVKTPANDYQAAGQHSVVFNGSGLASGTYHAVIRIGNHRKTIKMQLVK